MRRIPLLFTLAVLMLIFVMPLAAQNTDTNSRLSLTVGDVERAYTLRLPENVEAGAPLIIALHGAGSSGLALEAETGLTAAALEAGYVVAYPDSLEISWNSGLSAAGITLQNDAADAEFIAALIDEISATHQTDEVHIIGYSGGGLLAYRLACEISETLDSVTVVGPLMFEVMAEPCAETVTTGPDILVIHGDSDAFYRVESTAYPRRDGSPYVVMGVQETLDVWVNRYACDPESRSEENGVIRFDGCAGDAGVQYYALAGSVQSWPRPDTRVNKFNIDLSRMVIDYLGGSTDWAQTPMKDFAGQARSWVLYLPPQYDPAQPIPMVVALHGRFDTGANFAVATQFNAIAAREGFAVLYPDGQFFVSGSRIDRQWSYIKGLDFFPVQPAIDDIAYLRDLIEDLSERVTLDRSRLYLTGFSNGGFMTWRLACEASDLFAAFAPVGSAGFVGWDGLCIGNPPAPLLFIHGSGDTNIPWNGQAEQTTLPDGTPGEVYVVWPTLRTIAFWAVHNGCANALDERFIEKADESALTRVVAYTMTECAGAPFEFYLVENGGHNWPGMPPIFQPEIAGDINTDISASEVIWEFFSRFTLTAREPQTGE